MTPSSTEIELQDEITFLRKEIARLKFIDWLEEKYRAVFEQSTDGLLLLDADTNAFIECNTTAHRMLGYSREKFINFKIQDIEQVASEQDLKKRLDRIFKIGGDKKQVKVRTKDGKLIDVLAHAKPVVLGQKNYILVSWTDITQNVKTEYLLRKRREELESAIATIRVLLEQREKERAVIEQNFISDIKESLMPDLQKLLSLCTGSEKKHLEIVSLNIQNLDQKFPQHLFSTSFNLSPPELQVASLILQDKTTSEISELLQISESTVSFHRKNIRKKLKLSNSGKSLKKHLSELNIDRDAAARRAGLGKTFR